MGTDSEETTSNHFQEHPGERVLAYPLEAMEKCAQIIL